MLLRDQSTELASLIVSENGKTLAEAKGEVEKSAQFFEYYGGMAREPFGYLLADGRPGADAQVRYEPIGTVLIITPWNDPLLTPARKLAPALLAGNAIVFKPASQTPLAALELTRIFIEAGLPEYAINTITGSGSRVFGSVLAGDGISAVSFTGSTEVGIQLQSKLAGSNIRLQTEMGGKNATVVMSDANIDLAVESILASAFGQSGQRCTATSRILVADEISDTLASNLATAISQLTVGDGLDSRTQMGPLASANQLIAVRESVEKAKADGATLLAASDVAESSNPGGFYFPATLITDVGPNSDLWKKEVFGPVVALRCFASLQEAIDEVNNSDYGLSASIFTESLTSAANFIDKVETGQVSVNLPTTGWDIHHPFGGFKWSGSGYKEQGFEALNFYTRVKTVAIKINS